MLTWSGSTEGSSFGLNVSVVLEVQPGHNQGLGQTSTVSTAPVVPLLAEPAPTMGLLTSTEPELGTGHHSAAPWADTLMCQTGSVPLPAAAPTALLSLDVLAL